MNGIMTNRAEQQRDADLELYCDVLMIFMLVETVMGDCELMRELGAALDDGSRHQLEAAWDRFYSLPEDIRARIMEGDTSMQAVPASEERQDISAPDTKIRTA